MLFQQILLFALVWCSHAEETPHTRKYFYIGGKYITDNNGAHYVKDQVYVEQLTPALGKVNPVPLVLIHGLGQTGTVSQDLSAYQNLSDGVCRIG
jgi:hypothetical protein